MLLRPAQSDKAFMLPEVPFASSEARLLLDALPGAPACGAGVASHPAATPCWGPRLRIPRGRKREGRLGRLAGGSRGSGSLCFRLSCPVSVAPGGRGGLSSVLLVAQQWGPWASKGSTQTAVSDSEVQAPVLRSSPGCHCGWKGPLGCWVGRLRQQGEVDGPLRPRGANALRDIQGCFHGEHDMNTH